MLIFNKTVLIVYIFVLDCWPLLLVLTISGFLLFYILSQLFIYTLYSPCIESCSGNSTSNNTIESAELQYVCIFWLNSRILDKKHYKLNKFPILTQKTEIPVWNKRSTISICEQYVYVSRITIQTKRVNIYTKPFRHVIEKIT